MSLIPRSSLFDLDRFFESPTLRSSSSGIMAPLVDIKEKDDHYEISAELPGIKKEDIHVHVENGVLSIEASTSDEKTEEKGGKVIRKERYSGKMMRSFTLGSNIDESDIAANFNNGVLTLSVPKAQPEKPEARRIDIG